MPLAPSSAQCRNGPSCAWLRRRCCAFRHCQDGEEAHGLHNTNLGMDGCRSKTPLSPSPRRAACRHGPSCPWLACGRCFFGHSVEESAGAARVGTGPAAPMQLGLADELQSLTKTVLHMEASLRVVEEALAKLLGAVHPPPPQPSGPEGEVVEPGRPLPCDQGCALGRSRASPRRPRPPVRTVLPETPSDDDAVSVSDSDRSVGSEQPGSRGAVSGPGDKSVITCGRVSSMCDFLGSAGLLFSARAIEQRAAVPMNSAGVPVST